MSKPTFGGLLLSTSIVAIGIAAAWFVATTSVYAIVAGSFQRPRSYEMLHVTLAGEPVIARSTVQADTVEQVVVALDGRPVQVDTQQLLYPQYCSTGEEHVGQSPTNWTLRLAAANDGGSPAAYWYLVHDGRIQGKAYGIGYHARTRTVVGYFGSQGFSEQLPPREEWFEIAGGHGLAGMTPNIAANEPLWAQVPNLYFLASGKLWSFDTAKKQVTAVIDCPGAVALGMANLVPKEPPPPKEGLNFSYTTPARPQWLLVREAERLIVINPQSQASRIYPLPESLRRAAVAGFVLPDGNLLVLTMHLGSHPARQEAIWIDEEGAVARREAISVAGAATVELREFTAWSAVAGPAPLFALLEIGLLPYQLHLSGEAESQAAAFAQAIGLAWPALLAQLACGVASAVAAYRRQQRFGLPHALSWSLFAFALGIPGWIAYRWHRTWPVCEECPACHQLTPRDRDACADCGAVFPPPPLKGMEVFAH